MALERVEVALEGVVVELELEERIGRVGEVGGNLPGEAVLREAEPLDLGQPAEARGQLAGEPVVVDLELLERLGIGNFRGNLARELVVGEVELAELREAGAKAARERPLEPGAVDVKLAGILFWVVVGN